VAFVATRPHLKRCTVLDILSYAGHSLTFCHLLHATGHRLLQGLNNGAFPPIAFPVY